MEKSHDETIEYLKKHREKKESRRQTDNRLVLESLRRTSYEEEVRRRYDRMEAEAAAKKAEKEKQAKETLTQYINGSSPVDLSSGFSFGFAGPPEELWTGQPFGGEPQQNELTGTEALLRNREPNLDDPQEAFAYLAETAMSQQASESASGQGSSDTSSSGQVSNLTPEEAAYWSELSKVTTKRELDEMSRALMKDARFTELRVKLQGEELTEEEKVEYDWYWRKNHLINDRMNELKAESAEKRAAEIAAEENGLKKVLKSTLLALESGFTDGLDGIGKAAFIGSSVNFAPTVKEAAYAHELNVERVSQENWMNARLLDFVNGAASSSIGLAVGTLTGNPFAGAVINGLSGAGQSYEYALRSGSERESANLYAVLSGSMGTILQYGLGGIKGLSAPMRKTGTKIGKKVAEGLYRVVKNPQARVALNSLASYGAGMAREGLEEYLEGLLDPILRNVVLGENNEIRPFSAESLERAFVGVLTAGALNLAGRKWVARGDVADTARLPGTANMADAADIRNTPDSIRNTPDAADIRNTPDSIRNMANAADTRNTPDSIRNAPDAADMRNTPDSIRNMADAADMRNTPDMVRNTPDAADRAQPSPELSAAAKGVPETRGSELLKTPEPERYQKQAHESFDEGGSGSESAWKAADRGSQTQYLSEDGRTGVSIGRKDGEIGSWFSERGKELETLSEAVRLGGKKLADYDGERNRFYEASGFVAESRADFDPKQAPKGWDYEKQGKPDILFWRYAGEEAAQAAKPTDVESLWKSNYEVAEEWRDTEIRKAEEEKTIELESNQDAESWIGEEKETKNTAGQVDNLFDDGIIETKDIITDGSQLSDGKLKPNVIYQTGEYVYIYRTDEEGRIFHVRVEELHLTERTERLPHDPRTFDKLEDDDAGHLIGDRFGGSPKLDNLVSQAQKVNRSEYKVIENIWAKALKEGKKVSINIEVHYADGGTRPTGFTVQYAIDGKWKKQTIENKIERKRK